MAKTTLLFIFLSLFRFSLFSQNVGINVSGNAANSKSLLDIDVTGMSTKAGLLIPRMNTAERDAISTSGTTPESLLIYNTTTHCFESFYNGAWVAFGCIGCQLPGSFSASAATSATSTSFSANWSVSAGATAYYLDVSTSSTFASFVTGYNNLSVGNVLTYSVNTNLTCNTTYYYRVRANNACGTSPNSDTTLVSTLACWSCGSALTINHTNGAVAPETKTVNYGTVTTSLSGASKCWITQNLGADNQASSATDATDASAGWYWQFNRKQGYKVGPSPAWTITSINENSDWIAANDPCTIELGSGWRIPTNTEWSNADANGGWTNYIDTYNSVLKIHAAGALAYFTGTLIDRGASGTYSSSKQDTNTSHWQFVITNSFSSISNGANKAYGFSLRCIKD